MYLIVGRIADKKIVETVGIDGNIDLLKYTEAVAINHGGTSEDYSIFTLKSDEDWKRIISGDEYTVTWVDDKITGLDFSIEDDRKLFYIKTVDPLKKEAIKDTVVGNGVDSVIIQTRTCLSNNILDTSINGVVLIPFIAPDRRTIYLRTTLVNGVGTELSFKTTFEGVWELFLTNIIVGSEKIRIVSDNGPTAKNTINVLMDI